MRRIRESGRKELSPDEKALAHELTDPTNTSARSRFYVRWRMNQITERD